MYVGLLLVVNVFVMRGGDEVINIMGTGLCLLITDVRIWNVERFVPKKVFLLLPNI